MNDRNRKIRKTAPTLPWYAEAVAAFVLLSDSIPLSPGKSQTMAIDALQAAKHLARDSDWRYSHLEIQKALYVCQMLFLGYKKKPLVNGTFEAWDYGPVHPYLYHCLKYFGRQPVTEFAFSETRDLDPSVQGEEISFFRHIAATFPHPSGPLLVAITHWKKGAWAKHYQPGIKGIEIPNSDILAEYKERYKDLEEEESLG